MLGHSSPVLLGAQSLQAEDNRQEANLKVIKRKEEGSGVQGGEWVAIFFETQFTHQRTPSFKVYSCGFRIFRVLCNHHHCLTQNISSPPPKKL